MMMKAALIFGWKKAFKDNKFGVYNCQFEGDYGMDYAMTVCKVASESDIELNKVFYFIGRTNEEYSKSIIRLLSLEEVWHYNN